jgi:hypothetical protein
MMAVAFRTPGGSVSAAARREAKAKGQTQPGTDKFPIRNKADLRRAKQSIGRSSTPEATRAWINRRARALGAKPIGGGNSSKNGNSSKDGRISRELDRRLDQRARR